MDLSVVHGAKVQTQALTGSRKLKNNFLNLIIVTRARRSEGRAAGNDGRDGRRHGAAAGGAQSRRARGKKTTTGRGLRKEKFTFAVAERPARFCGNLRNAPPYP